MEDELRDKTKKVGAIINACREASGQDDESVLGASFNHLMDSNDDLVDFLFDLLTKNNSKDNE